MDRLACTSKPQIKQIRDFKKCDEIALTWIHAISITMLSVNDPFLLPEYFCQPLVRA